jgi:hypothetical protein
VQHGAAGIFGLELILQIERLKDVLGEIDRQLGGSD